MVLKSTPGASVPVYQVSGSSTSRSLPDWLVKKRKQDLKKDPEFQSRIQLIQDFEFEEASNRIKVTRDGQYAVATGTYKPQIHVYDFQQMSMKFERHTDAENVDFVMISDDWTKSVHLQSDRSVEFHAQGGIHTRTRIPKFGRSIDYNRSNCELYIAASGRDLYRLNIDQGRFMAPFETGDASGSSGLNVVKVNPAHGLIGVGSEEGTVEFWDPRTRRRAGILSNISADQNVSSAGNIGEGVTALAFHEDGLRMAAGNHEGITQLFDLRMSQPLLTKDQGYGFPIINLGYLDTPMVDNMIYSADKRIVKIWDTNKGTPYTSLEPSVDINDVAHIPNTGMFFLANEGIPMHTYYIPSLGAAPRWASFLDNITEELEEKPVTSVYENYKFVTAKELRQLGLDHLVGTNVVRAYMHGYFLDMRLYEKARLITNPYAYRDHREAEIRKRIEDERQSRIRGAKAKAAAGAKVNKEFAAENRENIDDRFNAMFEDPEYEIDETSYEYKLLHGGRGGSKPKTSSIEKVERTGPRGLTAVEEDEIDRQRGGGSDSDHSEAEDGNARDRRTSKDRPNKKKKNTKNIGEKLDFHAVNELGNTAEMSLGDQLSRRRQIKAGQPSQDRIIKGNAEISYTPKPKKKAPKPHGTDSGRSTSRGDGSLRKASKNTFRGM